MKYIKLFENIDWDWIDEEHEENVPIYKIGDKVKMHNFYAYYPKHPLKKIKVFLKNMKVMILNNIILLLILKNQMKLI